MNSKIKWLLIIEYAVIMGNIKDYDLLGWSDDKEIKNIIEGEKIYYSDFIYEITVLD